MKKLLILAVTVGSMALTGCATHPSAGASTIKFTDLNHVADCQYLGSVDGSSGWGGLASNVEPQPPDALLF